VVGSLRLEDERRDDEGRVVARVPFLLTGKARVGVFVEVTCLVVCFFLVGYGLCMNWSGPFERSAVEAARLELSNLQCGGPENWTL